MVWEGGPQWTATVPLTTEYGEGLLVERDGDLEKE